MMFCEDCQHQNEPDAKFCANCGAALGRLCPDCGRRNLSQAARCVQCGSPLEQPGLAGARRPASILATRAAREGERKHLTVLIADISGSTAFIDQLNAEEADRRLGEIMSAMREAVARFEGTVNKLQGDGIMALFGAPIPQEDHAVRACCAALAIIENVRKIDSAPPIRIGINTGEVVVRALPTDVSSQYDAMGRTVHIAARLEHEASDYGVAISGATLQATAGVVETELIGERALRGISEPIIVHALTGIRSAIASQQFRGGQRLSPFVGRGREMQVLQDALVEARAGRSPVIGIMGEAGSGKSRLIFEFLEGCRANGLPVLEARATGFGRATPLRPILDLYRTFFGIDDETTRPAAVERVRLTLERYGLVQDLPSVLDFLGLPLADRSALPGDVATRRMKLLEAAKRLARAVATAAPSVFVVEDLHWLDPASETFLEALAGSVAGTTTLMVVNFREDFDSKWTQPYFRQIAVTPLGSDAIDAILDHALGDDPSLLALRRRIVERSNGNPFFAEELVRAAIEQGAAVGAPGAYKAADAAHEAPLPSTIEAVLGSRIDRLPENDKLFLQAASVVGKEFSLSVVAKVAHIALQLARASLQLLVGAEMLYERPDVQRDDFAFRHPLVQEAAYGSLLSEHRKQLHRGTAAALAVKFADRLDEYSSLVAYHWEKGGENLSAAQSYLRFALWIGAREPRHALDSWRNVRRLIQDDRSGKPEIEYMLMMACGQIVNLAWWEGIDASEIEPVFAQAMTLARKLKDMRAAALITMAFGRILLITGSSDDYVTKVEEARKLIDGPGNESVEAFMNAVHSHALLSAGLLERALEANTLALATIHQLEPRDRQQLGFDPDPWLRTQRARILMGLDRFAEADAVLGALLSGPPLEIIHLVNAHGTRIEGYRRTRPDLAAKEGENLRAALRENANPYLRVLGDRYGALALLADNRPQEAVDLLGETIAYARSQNAGLELEPYLLTILTEALISIGSPSAPAMAAEALHLARKRAMRIAEREARALQLSLEPSDGAESA